MNHSCRNNYYFLSFLYHIMLGRGARYLPKLNEADAFTFGTDHSVAMVAHNLVFNFSI